jgi:hypothetical protein
MRIRRNWAAVLLCSSLCGCGSLFHVVKFDPNKPQGIPFYVKQGVCVHQTVYANRYWQLTLKVTSESGIGTEDVIKIKEVDHIGHDFNALLHELEKPSPDTDSVVNAWTALKRSQFDPWSQSDGRVALENSSSLTNVVDYSVRYSINQKKPLAGSSNADFKLGSDGTLNETSGQTQDNTLSTILSALPVSTLITSAAGVATKTGAAANESAKVVKFSLMQEQRYIKTVYSQSVVASDSICTVGKELTEADQNISTSRSDVGSNSNPNNSGQNDSDSITVSGTIKLPKPVQTSATADSKKNGEAAPNASGQGAPPSNQKKKD